VSAPSDPLVHEAAQIGFSREAATYSRGRPGYPPELLGWLRESLKLRAGGRALDLGAGTGKFTPLLRATDASVVAIEPVAAMREQLQASLPEVRVLAGSAQSLPLADASLDAVVCAQAFHWFAVPKALHEIARVLKPDGKLGLVWNVRDESVDWVAAITRIITPFEAGTPRYHSGQWRTLFPGELFGPLQETALPFEHVGSPTQVILERIGSVSFIAALQGAQRDRVTAELQELIATHPQLAGRARIGFPYVTRAYMSTRNAASAGASSI
jgi:SAM-dependent methyltransferase